MLHLKISQLIFKGNCSPVDYDSSSVQVILKQEALLRLAFLMSDTVHSSSEISAKRQHSLNLSCNSMAHSWTLNILMSFWWPHQSNSTQFHCQPRAHRLLPTFISLKLLPQCLVFIDLSEQPFGLSHSLVIGHRPPPTTAGGWIYLAADMPPTWHPLCFGLICWTPKENTIFLYQQ